MSNAATALVLKPITRCEWGTMDEGLLADTFDRVEVCDRGTWSCGTRWYQCRTESGEEFQAIEGMVQLD